MMESDAYSSFIAVDQELAAPVYSFGLIAGTQYADTPELRHSLEVLKRAVQYWKSRGPLSFVAHLGNALSATNETGQQWPALHSFDEARRNGNDCKQWHLTPGAHDLSCFGASQLAASVMPCRAGDGLYYAFSPAAGWRVLVLDSYDVSLLAHEPGSDAHTATLGLLQTANPNPPGAPDPLAGLEGEARRWGPSGGGLGAVQLSWFGAQLEAASRGNERVIVLCHLSCLPAAARPEGLLYNFAEAQAIVDAHPATVAAWISGADGDGGYARDEHGVHHLTPAAAAGCAINSDAYGSVEVYHDRLKLHMVGRAPGIYSGSQVWPEELDLPQGGKLVDAAQQGLEGLFALFPALFRMFVLIATSVFAPLSPVLKMLTSNDDDAAAEADAPAPAPAPAADDRPPATAAAAAAASAVKSAASAAASAASAAAVAVGAKEAPPEPPEPREDEEV